MSFPTWAEASPVLAVLSPIIVILVSGLWLDKSLEKLKSRLQLNQAIIAKRADVYADLQEDLNKIYSYIKRVGDWKELTPNDVLKCKRKVDQQMYSTKPYWSKECMDAYNNFMKTCFVTNRGHGINAGIIADLEKYKSLQSWNHESTNFYAGEFDENKFDQSNDRLMKALSKDFGVES